MIALCGRAPAPPGLISEFVHRNAAPATKIYRLLGMAGQRLTQSARL